MKKKLSIVYLVHRVDGSSEVISKARFQFLFEIGVSDDLPFEIIHSRGDGVVFYIFNALEPYDK